MTLALIEALEEEGMSPEAIIRVLKKAEATADRRSSGAKRQARYRERKRLGVTGDVTGDVTDPPKNISNPHSVSDETAAEPRNVVKEIFDLGVSLLKSQGMTEARARSVIGKWREGGKRDGDVAAALVDAKQRSISNLVEWMPKRLAAVRAGEPPGGDFLDHYLEKQRLSA